MKAQLIILLIIFLSLFSCNKSNETVAEDDPRSGRLYRSEKIGFFTEQMNLSESEAQKFWPVYNTYDRQRDSLWRTKRHFMMEYNKGNLDVENAGDALEQFLELDVKSDSLRRNFVKDLKTFLSDEKILQMFATEHQFKFFMLNRIRGRHGNGRGHGRGMGRAHSRAEQGTP